MDGRVSVDDQLGADSVSRNIGLEPEPGSGPIGGRVPVEMPNRMSEGFLSPAETARRLGVGVRALRLYERKGLVRPGRTRAGWRVYGPNEIERLHQVLTLKSLGLSLARIGELLDERIADLPALLALQEDVLTVRINDLRRARKSVQAARSKVARDNRLSLDDLLDLVRETTMTTIDEARLAASSHQVPSGKARKSTK